MGRIILSGINVKVTPRILSETQRSFHNSSNTSYMVFGSRQIQEKYSQQNMELYVVFKDFTKA